MSRVPPRGSDRGYQPLQSSGGPGLPPRPTSNSGGLFDRRGPRSATPPTQYDTHHSADRRQYPSSNPQQQNNSPGFLSKLTHRGGHDSPRMQGGIFRVSKVHIILKNKKLIRFSRHLARRLHF